MLNSFGISLLFVQLFGGVFTVSDELNDVRQYSRSFRRVPFQIAEGKSSKPLISLSVRAFNQVYLTKKDELLKEISADKFKQENAENSQNELVFQSKSPTDSSDRVAEAVAVRIYPIHIESEPSPLSSTTEDPIVEMFNKEDQDYRLDDGFKMIYDRDRNEYSLVQKSAKIQGENPKSGEAMKPKIEQPTKWSGGDSKEETNDEKVERILIDSLVAEQLEDEGVANDSLIFTPGKSKKRVYQLNSMDPEFLEKEEFSAKLPAEDLEPWRSRLINLTLLEEQSADAHRDYGSSYILPVLKSVKYDNTSVPLAFDDIPVNVAVSFNFLYLANFDSQLMEYSIDVEMEFSWFDIRLVNNYTKPIRIREKSILEQIWRPDPYIVNSKYSYFHYVSFPNVRMRITPQGLVTYTLRISSVCSCFMSFCLYPHDRQECDLRMSSIAYSNQYVKFYWHSNPIRFQSKITLPELHITKIRTGECTTIGKMVESSCLQILFSLERDSARFVIEKYVPSTLAMMFAWVASYVPYNYEDVRIITPITVLLTLVQMEKGDKEIRTSYLTSIDVWFAAMKSFTVLSLLESSAVLALIKRSRAMMKNAERAANEFERCSFEAEAHRLNRLYHQLDSICRFASPIAFIIFFVYYVLFVAQGNEKCLEV